MSNKKQKKRTKRYQGEDAKRPNAPTTTEPVVHRYEAVERSRFSEWLQPRKRALRVAGTFLGGGAITIWLLIELLQMVF